MKHLVIMIGLSLVTPPAGIPQVYRERNSIHSIIYYLPRALFKKVLINRASLNLEIFHFNCNTP